MLMRKVFIFVLGCSVQCLSYSLFSNFGQISYLDRVSRQARTCKQSERLCQSGECYPKRVFCDGIADCADGSDETSICSRTCSPLVSPTVDVKCTRNGLDVDCTKPVLHDTRAEVSCKRHYHLPPYRDIPAPYNRLICDNGAWDFNLLECVPVCGMRNYERSRRIILGHTAKVGEFPWHVGIHIKRQVEGNTVYNQICGGSIINSKIVITAAQCVESKNPKQYGVSAGKFYRLWDDKKDEHAQFRNVEQLHFPESYKGVDDTYANDIAIIIVDKPFEFGDLVRPICIVDWTAETEEIDKKTLIYGALGYVPGWGLTRAFGDYSDELKYVQTQVLSDDLCHGFLQEYLPSVASEDKICAGRTDAHSICEGDTGGGLAVALGDAFYLMATVSVTATKDGTCDPWRYSTFTKMSSHAKWIQRNIIMNTPAR